MGEWMNWVNFFRDSVQNQMKADKQIVDSYIKDCSTKVGVFNADSGIPMASDSGFAQFKVGDVLKLVNGTQGDQEVFSGISWGSGVAGESPIGYSIIRLVPYPLKSEQFNNLYFNILYGRNKAFPEESIIVAKTLTSCVVVLLRITGANKGLISKAIGFFGDAISTAINTGV